MLSVHPGDVSVLGGPGGRSQTGCLCVLTATAYSEPDASSCGDFASPAPSSKD